MTFPGVPAAPAVGDEITAADIGLIIAALTYLQHAPNGNGISVLGPSTSQTYGAGTSAVMSVTGTCVPGRTYLVLGGVSGQKITAAGTMQATLVETTSGFSPPLTGTGLTWSGGGEVAGSSHAIWTPNAGQTTMTWQLNVSVGTASYEVTALCASIVVVDIAG